MTDDRLRELERRWKETGSVEDEAAWLSERVRAGYVTHDQVLVAAYLGLPPARLALGADAPTIPSANRDWVSGLRHFAKIVSVVGAVTVARNQLHIWTEWAPGDGRPGLAIEAASAWIQCPCDDHARAAEAAYEAAHAASRLTVAASDWNQVPRTARASIPAARAAGKAADSAACAARAAAALDARRASEHLLGVIRSPEDTDTLRNALRDWSNCRG